MEMLKRFEPLALVLVIVGALNWGIFGLTETNVLAEIFGTGTVIDVVYVVVGVAGLMFVRGCWTSSTSVTAPSARASDRRSTHRRRPRAGHDARPASFGRARLGCARAGAHLRAAPLDRGRRRRRRHHRGVRRRRRGGRRRRPATAFVRGSTAALTTMEYEPGGVTTCRALLDRLIPAEGDYEHNRLNHDTNSHAHQRASLIGPSRVGPGGRRPARARHLAAARPRRLRRPPARADRRRPGALMSEQPAGPKAVSAVELKAQIEAEREGRPFLVYRDAEGEQQLVTIDEGTTEIGRAQRLGRRPARLGRGGLAPARPARRRRRRVDARRRRPLAQRLVRQRRAGQRPPAAARRRHAALRADRRALPRAGQPRRRVDRARPDALTAAGVSPAQRRVLVALCRPFKEGTSFATPATNQQIADELYLSRRRGQDPHAGAVRELRGRPSCRRTRSASRSSSARSRAA